jgi:hypothetical protein
MLRPAFWEKSTRETNQGELAAKPRRSRICNAPGLEKAFDDDRDYRGSHKKGGKYSGHVFFSTFYKNLLRNPL